MTRTKILIVGGYGTFGGRLVRLLAVDVRLALVVAGRSQPSAREFCQTVAAKAELIPAVFDRDGDLEAQLASIGPAIVVDASGPFQTYGRDPYRLVRAAIARGAHYLDLADGSDFVDGVAAFDGDALARGVFVLSGVSTVPMLTAAALRELSRGFPPLKTVCAGLATSPFANMGQSVIRAIASYAGKPVALLKDGVRSKSYALIDSRRYTIAPPGRLPLKNRRFSLAAVPDLTVLPKLWPSLNSAWFGVATAPQILHRVLNGFAWLVRLKFLPSLAPLTRLMHWIHGHVRWGEHRSGLFVHATGARDDGATIERSWHLIAEGDDGPFIPAMPAAIIISQWLAGRSFAPGARAAAGEVELGDYEAQFAQRKIYSGWRDMPRELAGQPLYRRLLGEAWDSLPRALCELHGLADSLVAKGRAKVGRGDGILARLVAEIVGFPTAGDDVPVEVRFRSRDGREYWLRNFAGREFASTQEEGRGRFAHLLCERFGPCVFGMAVVLDGGKLRLVVRRWTFLGIPLPTAWAPYGEAYEHAENDRFNFHVEISHPFTGLIVKYRGWLVPERVPADNARQRPSDPALVGAK